MTNAAPDIIIDCKTDSTDPVLKVIPKGHIETSRIVGATAPASDASIALGADCQILVGATQSYGLRIRADGNVAVGGLGGSTSRFSVQGTVGGADVYGANIIPDFNHNATISVANAVQVNPKFSSDVTQAFLYTNAKLTTTDKVGKLTAFNYTIDYNDPAAKEATSENRAFATNLRKAEGKDNWAIIASGDAPSFFAGDVRNPAGSNPENDDSLVTKGWVTTNGASGNLPISSTDNKVTLSDDGNGEFIIECGTQGNKAKRFCIDGKGHAIFGANGNPRDNTALEVVGDYDSPFQLILTNVATVEDSRSGMRMYNNTEGAFLCEMGLDSKNRTYGFSGGTSGGSQFITGNGAYDDISIKPQTYVQIRDELHVDDITTKSAASGDPSDGTKDGDKVIRLKGNQVQITDQDNNPGTGGYSLDIRDNRGMVRIRNDDVVNGINDTATIALDVSSNSYNSSIEFRTGNVKRAEIVKQGISGNQYWAQYCSNGSASGLEFRTAYGQVTEKTFETYPTKTVISTFEQDNDPDSDNYRGIKNYADRLTITDDDVNINVDESVELGCSDPTQEASPKLWFRGYVKDGVNASDVPTTVRNGYMQGYLAPEAVNKGDFRSNVGIWSQLGSPPYNRANADLEVTYDGNVQVNNGGLIAKSLKASQAVFVVTDSSTCAVFESTTQSAQVKCIAVSGTTWHGINNGQWAVDYYPTGTTTYTEGLRLDLADGRVTSKGGIGTDKITSKSGASNNASIELGANLVANVGDGQVINFQVNNAGKLTIADNDITTSTGYTPTQPSSIATKAYVDANAGGGGSSGVNKIIAGSNITVSPLDGTGNVTVNAVVPDVGVTKIIGGTNVTVSPADGTGTVTINATSSGGGGAESLVDLDDVVVTDPKGNEVLTYDITTGKWINKAPPSGGNGGIIDGGQVPGTGSTFIWYDTEYKDITHINGEIVKQYADQPRYMYAYDGVFSDGTFWTLDGVNFRVDPNAISSGGRYGGKFSTTSYTQFQGRVIAGEFGYWAEKYFSQDMKQWSEKSGSYLNLPAKQGLYPTSVSSWKIIGHGGSQTTYTAFEQFKAGDWKQAYCNNTLATEVFPDTTETGCWTSNQFSGEETAMARKSTEGANEHKIYCFDTNPDSFTYSDTAEDARNANTAILKNSVTEIPALEGCTTGFFSERLQKWLFAKANTVFISNTVSLKGGFTTKSLPRSNDWDRCYDDGSSIVFARTESGNSATVFSADAGQSWSVSISLINRNYKNFAGTNGRAMATYEYEAGVDDFIPDPSDPSGEGVLPIKYAAYRYAVSGVDDPNPAEASTRNIKLTHPVSISSAKAIEAQTQEDANEIFTEEIQRRSPVLTLTQAEYDAIPADEIEDDTLYLITS